MIPALSWAQTPDAALQKLLQSKSIDRNNTEIYVWDIDADYQVIAHRADKPIVPASVMKCVSTAALISALPYDHRMETKVYLEGKTEGGVLKGNLLVVGCGDPSLGDRRHSSQSDFVADITGALLDAGITEITGKIKVDDNYFAGPAACPSWAAADLSQAYGTGCHAFNFEGNASGKAAIKNPDAVFIRKLTASLKEAGIKVGDTAASPTGNKKLLMAYESPSLADLMRSCMFRSDNLYAETFLRHFGRQNGADGSVKESARLAMRHWEALGFPTDGIEIVDGSGLSRDNRLTAQFLGEVLLEMSDDPIYVSFFPLTGEEGTVRNFLTDTPLEGYMALKTGSMNGIQSYAGYVLDEDFQPTHVVVVMTNDMKNRAAFRQALTEFFLTLFT